MDPEKKATTQSTHVESVEDGTKGHTQIELEAREASDIEHSMGIMEAIKVYPKAVIWSIIVSLTICMEGYDVNLMPNLIAYPSFKRDFGQYFEGVGYQLTGTWQVLLTTGYCVGTVIGVFMNGYLSERFGHRWTLMGSLAILNALIFLMFFATNVEMLFASQFLCGLPWGVFATIGPAYASEVCPLALRGILTSYINVCFCIGQFISAGVLNGLVSNDTEWSYRIPFAVQWAWPLPIMIFIYFAPDSPWWLVRKGNLEGAKKNLQRLVNEKRHGNLDKQISLMIYTDEVEREIESGTSYFDCFKGIDLRRTEISCCVFAGQVLSGNNFAYGGTYFFEQAGMDPSESYKLGFGSTAMALAGTLLSWFVMNMAGRRPIFVSGLATMTIILLLIGFLSFSDNDNVRWAQAAFTMIWLFVYSLTVGPLGWAIPSEMSSMRLRNKTICLARNTYYVLNIAGGALEPYMMNPTEWNWKAKTGFFWAGSCLIITIWAFFRLPESKGRMPQELDILFSKRISARKFSKHRKEDLQELDADERNTV